MTAEKLQSRARAMVGLFAVCLVLAWSWVAPVVAQGRIRPER
jgi:hypothetical protein